MNFDSSQEREEAVTFACQEVFSKPWLRKLLPRGVKDFINTPNSNPASPHSAFNPLASSLRLSLFPRQLASSMLSSRLLTSSLLAPSMLVFSVGGPANACSWFPIGSPADTCSCFPVSCHQFLSCSCHLFLSCSCLLFLCCNYLLSLSCSSHQFLSCSNHRFLFCSGR